MTGAKSKPTAAPESRFKLPKRTSGVLNAEQRELTLHYAEAFLSVATAPYAEDLQLEVVKRFVAERDGFELTIDEYANAVVRWKGGSKPAKRKRGDAPLLAFSAHLDHPGFLYTGKRDGKHHASWHGGVPERYFKGSLLRFYDVKTGAELATAKIAKTYRNQRKELQVVLSNFRGQAKSGMFGMWDLTAGEIRGTKLHARVCDDLMGAAAILATLDLLAVADHPHEVLGVFTRAEETGFIGCQGLLRADTLGKGIAVIGLECSPKRPTAKIGKGPVIRVGDAGMIFEPWITHRLQEAAAGLSREHADFQFQRALMDGGRCESSAFNLWDVPAGAMCLALGNYHNCHPDGSIQPEIVDWSDHEGMVALMVRAAELWHGESSNAAVMRRLDLIWEAELPRLSKSSKRMTR
jgi:M42 glutamyl aminopeptidase